MLPVILAVENAAVVTPVEAKNAAVVPATHVAQKNVAAVAVIHVAQNVPVTLATPVQEETLVTLVADAALVAVAVDLFLLRA